MDQENPAHSALTAIPPALLADMVDDPSLLRNIAIPMAAIQLNKLHQLTLNPNLPVGQRIQIAEYTTKIAEIGAYAKASQQGAVAGPGLSVQIIFNKADDKPTIDVKASDVKEITANA